MFNKELCFWDNNDVNSWLKNIELENYVEYSINNQITGYDLCIMNSIELQKCLNLNNHNANVLNRNLKVLKLDLIKINLISQDKNIAYQLEFDPTFTIDNLSHATRDLFKSKENIYFVTSDSEVLASNCRLIELILLNPKKYKRLKVIKTIDSFTTEDTKILSNHKTIEEKYNDIKINPQEFISLSKHVKPTELLNKDIEKFNYKNNDLYNYEKFMSINLPTTNINKYENKLDFTPARYNNVINSMDGYMSSTENIINIDNKDKINYTNNMTINYSDKFKEEINMQNQRISTDKRIYRDSNKESIGDYKFNTEEVTKPLERFQKTSYSDLIKKPPISSYYSDVLEKHKFQNYSKN